MTHALEPMDVDSSFTEDYSHENDETNVQKEILKPNTNPRSISSPFVTGIDIFCKEEQSKMEMRAKRFGLEDKIKISPLETDENVYISLGITDENESTKNLRLNVLHMRGTEDMSTKDVFKYFEHYAPASIEWINDVSCNVVWHDNITAARALLRLSKKIIGLGQETSDQKEIKSEKNNDTEKNKLSIEDTATDEPIEEGECKDEEMNDEAENEDAIDIKDIDFPLPPGIWRKGIDCPKSKGIFLRFATRADKKQPGAEKMSEYYRKYGNPNFGGIKGLLTESRKRIYKEALQSKKHADEAQIIENDLDQDRKNPWGTLSKTWGQNDPKDEYFERPPIVNERTTGIKKRLGLKSNPVRAPIPMRQDLEEESEEESSSDSSDDQWCKRSKVLRMRMHADDEEEKLRKKRRKQVVNTKSKCNDLRSRLDNTEKSLAHCDSIQVVVTNTPKVYTTPPVAIYEDDGTTSESVLEQEEGEWLPYTEESDEKVKTEEEEYEKSEDSDVSEKEIQGPKGSVIKVVPRVKPRVASTVWARLNNTNSSSQTSDRSTSKGSLRGNVQGDLRSRLGYHKRGRSPLRIEVKNDKYAEESSGTD